VTSVILKNVTVENWQQCINLRVNDDQADFVPGNLYSIAEAQFYPQAVPLAIYDGEGQMVGFIMYGVDVTSGKWKIFSLMIDKPHQGKGYGRAAMQQVINQIAAQPGRNEILVSYKPANRAAQGLYASLGFVEQKVSDEQVVACLDLKERQDVS